MYRFVVSALFVFGLAWSNSHRVHGSDQIYQTQIKPLLHEKCYSCHGAIRQESNLRLDTRQFMVDGGDSGPVLVPGDAAASELFQRARATDDSRMPPPGEGSALTESQLNTLRQWIQKGAVAPEETPLVPPEKHWAFQPIQRPVIPTMDNASDAINGPTSGGQPERSGASSRDDISNPIDALLAAKRRALGLVHQPLAPRSIQIRRLYLDLIGLPPTPEQLHDQRSWHVIVDELLANPHHGERWGRHWMDIWRYSDWYGLGQQLRYSQKHIWRWRDWIIGSLNRDKGYDQMILEMLAGDELNPLDAESITGTGFLARNYYLFNRTTWLDSTIEHTGKAFLGLTINCAKCHDHKYDPISQEDYYRFRAIFEPHQVRRDAIPGVTDLEHDALPRVFDDDPDAVTYLHLRGDPKQPDTSRPIPPGVPAIFDHFAPPIEPVALPRDAYAPGTRSYVRRDQIRLLQSEIEDNESKLAEAKLRLARRSSNPVEPIGQSSAVVHAFDHPDSAQWQIVGDGWQYVDGALHQRRATRERQYVSWTGSLPKDFELELDYTLTGGTTYKSVSVRFDESDDQSYANYVYTSAHDPAPKIQVAYVRQGKSFYPTDGRRSHSIETGRRYRLRFAVQGTLVNVWLDDRFMVAYRFPDRRSGRLSISGFDATVALHGIRIRPLPTGFVVAEAGESPATNPEDLRRAVEVAHARLAASRAKLDALQAAIAADVARYDQAKPKTKWQPLARRAAIAQAQSSLAAAQYRALADADDPKQVKAAKDQIAEYRQTILSMQTPDAPVPDYESVRGSIKALESPVHKVSDYPPVYASVSTGRRLALARWMVSPENPLTARVAANHVWTRHFGKPLVESMFDFGLRAPKPLHHDVLDLLAYELIQSGWSLRHLHRMITTSNTYRRTSSSRDADPQTRGRDPENLYYWRMNWRRMESQVIRDSLLALADQLDLTIGGASIDPSPGARRRSIYFKHSRDAQDQFLEMFDNADILQCYRREESIVPQQALAMSNSKLAIEMSGQIERRISQMTQADAPDAFIKTAFKWLLGREATENEIQQCEWFLEEMDQLNRQRRNDPQMHRARQWMIHSLLNHNDFITIR